MLEINNNSKYLISPLKKFFSNEKHLKTLISILNNNRDIQSDKISLRLIDWFVTNYCKKMRIILTGEFNIYDSYKANLKAYSKKLFDPFRRKNDIILTYNVKNKLDFVTSIPTHDKFIITTIGQLNFFKWIIDNNIYTYIKKHKETIEKDMILSQKENTIKKQDKNNLIFKVVKTDNGEEKTTVRKRRQELTRTNRNPIYVNKTKTKLIIN